MHACKNATHTSLGLTWERRIAQAGKWARCFGGSWGAVCKYTGSMGFILQRRRPDVEIRFRLSVVVNHQHVRPYERSKAACAHAGPGCV